MRNIASTALALGLCLLLSIAARADNTIGETVTTPNGLFTVENVLRQETIEEGIHPDSDGGPLYWIPDTGTIITFHGVVPGDRFELLYYTVTGGEVEGTAASATFDANESGDVRYSWLLPEASRSYEEFYSKDYVAMLAYKDATLALGFVKTENGVPVELTPDEPGQGDTPDEPEESIGIVPTRQRLTVNGVERKTEIYNINGSNYFKLRDMAALLSGTGSSFSVDYDDATKLISVVTGASYTKKNGDLTLPDGETMAAKAAQAVRSRQSIQVNGERLDLVAYNIGGNNYFKLRDMGEAMNFDVGYDDASKTMLVTSR